MKQHKLLFFALIIFLLSGFTTNAQEQELMGMSLEECVLYAFDHAREVQNADLEREIAQGQVGEVLSIGLPQVNADVGLNYNYKVQQSIIDISTFDPSVPEGTEQAVQFGQAYDANAIITIEQLIFKGSYFVGLKAAKTLKEISEKEFTQSKIEIAEAVSKAYFNALISRSRLDLAQQNFNRIDSLYRETQILYDNGFVETLDLLRSQVDFNNTKIDLENSEYLNDYSLQLLKFQMGMPVKTPIFLSENLRDMSIEIVESEIENFSYGKRNDYSILQTSLELAYIDVKNERVQYYPEFNAFMNYGTNTAAGQGSDLFDFSDRWFGYGAVGASMRIPIFDGLYKSNRIQQRRAKSDQVKNATRQLENSIDLEITRLRIDLEVSLKNAKAQKENLSLADEIYRAAKLKYEQGLGTSLEITDANTRLREAQIAYLSAIFDLLVIKTELEKALGILLPKYQ
jgi:outer membrane protein TolC